MNENKRNNVLLEKKKIYILQEKKGKVTIAIIIYIPLFHTHTLFFAQPVLEFAV